MKSIVTLLILLFFITSCKQQPKNYITFSGEITNKNSDSLVLSSRKLKFKKVIKVNKDGTFKDTFKLKSPNFISLFDGKEYGVLFLKNGADVKMTLDAELFDETISYSGEGSKESSFLAKKAMMEEEFMKDDSLFVKSKKEFKAKVRKFHKTFLRELEETESHDSLFLASLEKKEKGFKKLVNKTYKDKTYILKNLSKGTPSPKFTNPYKNYKGGETTLDDLKGKYVYLDLWATWCGYCKEEVPYFKKLAEEYKDKNIIFVGISVDSKNKFDAWKKYVEKYKLPGEQLFTGLDKKFNEKYRVTGIPRFILLDTIGQIIEAEAPKPSDPKIKELFDSLK